MDEVFEAIADSNRRHLLDRLRAAPGLTLGQLAADLPMSRQAVTRHLQALESAGLVAVRWAGREKHHFLNPVPLFEIQHRWMDQFSIDRVAALHDLKQQLETDTMSEFVYVIVIDAPREKVWQALCDPEFTFKYWHRTRVRSTFETGTPIEFLVDGDAVGCDGVILASDPPAKLAYTWRFPRNPEMRDEAPSRVTFTLEKLGTSTKLTIVHDEFPQGSKMRQTVSEGWPLVLSGLKTLLEKGATPDFSTL